MKNVGRNWFNILPATLAEKQFAWEMEERIIRAHKMGATMRQIANKTGIHFASVAAKKDRGLWRRQKVRQSPVEKYLTRSFNDYEVLSGKRKPDLRAEVSLEKQRIYREQARLRLFASILEREQRRAWAKRQANWKSERTKYIEEKVKLAQAAKKHIAGFDDYS